MTKKSRPIHIKGSHLSIVKTSKKQVQQNKDGELRCCNRDHNHLVSHDSSILESNLGSISTHENKATISGNINVIDYFRNDNKETESRSLPHPRAPILISRLDRETENKLTR